MSQLLVAACLLSWLLGYSSLGYSTLRQTAFFYGANPPMAELSQYDDVVVEPAQLSEGDLQFMQAQSSQLFAYFSLGEVTELNAREYKLNDDWFIARNPGWQSKVPDQTNPEWQQWVVHQQIATLKALGYDGLFLDTLDSFHLATANGADPDEQIAALISTIREIRSSWPEAKLFFNRGFELLDALHSDIYALAAESLYVGWNASTQKYQAVAEQDRQWLLGKLNEVKQYDIPVTVIDYLPTEEKDKARSTAKKISDAGFSPWVSNPALDRLGESLLQPAARRVLVIYDSHEGPLEFHPAHVALGAPLEYLGLVSDYHDIRTGIPASALNGIYAGVITLLTGEDLGLLRELTSWAEQLVNGGIPLVIFDYQPFTDANFQSALGIAKLPSTLKKPLKITLQSELVGKFEAAPRVKARTTPLFKNMSDKNESLLSIVDSENSSVDPVLIAPWGGMALRPFSYQVLKDDKKKWVIEPIDFLKHALQLPDMPIPDASTENGLRILTSHVDGDGFVSRAEMPGAPYSGNILYDRIFSKYLLPHTVSVIEGEVGPKGLYPKQSPALEDIARKIFRLENVELASHSFSHPFFWQPDKLKGSIEAKYGVSMPIPDYKVDMKREVIGSIDYINSRLAPKDKRVKVMLWTGDALPGAEAIHWTKVAGVANFNGGNTIVTNRYSSISGVYPQVRKTSAGMQIYAPIMNENVYTNDWTGPFYGFKNVIETFQLTGNPRRLKPITIYWHFYSGTKEAAIRALEEIYDWTLKQEHNPQYVSEYAPKVEGSYTASFSKVGDKHWKIRGLGALRTVRLPVSLGYPDLVNSRGVAGWLDSPTGRYVHLSKPEVTLITSSEKKSARPRLHKANGMLDYWRSSNNGAEFRLYANAQLDFSIVHDRPCQLNTQRGSFDAKSKSINELTIQQFKLSQSDTGNAILVCK